MSDILLSSLSGEISGVNLTATLKPSELNAMLEGDGEYIETSLDGNKVKVALDTDYAAEWSGKADAADLDAVEDRVDVIEGKEAGWDAKSTVVITDENNYIKKISVDSVEHNIKPESVTDVQMNNNSILDGTIAKFNTVNAVDGSAAGNMNPLTANQGKLLNDRINNLQNIGRFLAIWNAATGLPLSNPQSMPYTYKTGDYYRVGTVSQSTNYMPNGSSYNGQASTTVYSGQGLSEGAVFYYDGTQWLLQASGGGGLVSDVQVNGTSILSGGVANIPLAGSAINGAMSSAQYTKLAGIEAGADVTDATNVEAAGAIMKTAQSLTDGEKTQARTNIGAASYTYSSTAPTTLDENTIHFVV